MKPSNHPRSCQVCRGSGWQDGPPVEGHATGHPIRYTTVEPCTHLWHDDNRADDEPLAWDHPRARAAFERGYAQGHAELAAMQPEENP